MNIKNSSSLSGAMIAFLFFFTPLFASASTSLGYQSLPGNTIWTPSASPYLINGWINIPTGSSLTILPGTIVKFNDGAKLEVNGTLDAQGTPTDPVSITALTDDTVGGDSNGDGASSSPHPGSWGNIQIRPSATVTFTNTHLAYGGLTWGSGYQGTIANDGGTLTITDSVLTTSAGQQGILHNSGTTTIRTTTFSALADAIHAETLSGITNMGSLTISNNTFTSVSRAVFISNYLTPFSFNNEGGNQGGGITMNTVNLFGSTTLPADLPYTIENWVSVPEGSSLTIMPGATFKGANSISHFGVSGSLIAEGTKTQPITFTSSAPTPHAGDWGGIIINSTGSTTLSHVNLSHGGASYWSGSTFYQLPQLRNDGGLLLLDHVTSASSSLAGLSITGGTTTVTHSTFRDNQYGIMRTEGNLSLIDSAIVHNGTSGFINSGSIIDARNNWWGDASGPFHSTVNPTGTGNSVSDHVAFLPWSACDPTGNDTAHECSSNVLFLPGAEASRLYEPLACDQGVCEKRLWEPVNDVLALRLAHDADGISLHNDIYAKDVIDNAYLPIAGNVYKSFIEDMNALQTKGTIHEWEAIPYDWRLTPDQILSSGKQIGGDKISYLLATSSPYIIQELKRLAANSPTGKVTIIAHSNGGLVTKRLTELLGTTTASQLIDKIIFVAVPQLGTPKAIGAILHGYDQGLPVNWASVTLAPETARTLATNMPSAYNLLPSDEYFHYVNDPVATFVSTSSPLLAQFAARYGTSTHSVERLRAFMTDMWRSASSTPSDTVYPSVGNSTLFDMAQTLHNDLDHWSPPEGVQLTTIAGWGEETLSTIEYRGIPHPVCSGAEDPVYHCWTEYELSYDPKHVIDGDGTVVEPSALWANGAAAPSRYWVDLEKYNNKLPESLLHLDVKHADIFEIPTLRTLLQNIIINKSSASLDFISTIAPQYTGGKPRLHFTLHSPLTLGFKDIQGNYSGATATSTLATIPGVTYERYGEVQWLSIPKSLAGQLILQGTASGSFTLDAEEVNGNDTLSTTSFEGIPSSTSTIVTMDIVPTQSVTASSTLVIDQDGNGTPDLTLHAKENDIVTPIPPDTTPPEAFITFSTSTNSISITGIDDSGTTTISSTTTFPVLKKNQKQYNGIATTTVTIKDLAGNTTKLIYTEKLPSPEHRDIINLISISYNGATTTIPATLKYKWTTKPDGSYKMFASTFATSTVLIESHYRPKKNQTLIMSTPIDLDDTDTDDDADMRPIKTKLQGFVIPSLVTKRGKINVNY